MMRHCCHLFKEAFDLKPMSGSRDKMRLVPLNTPGDTQIDPQYCSPKKSGVALRFPPHSTKPFLDCAGKAKRRRRFSHTRSPEEEKLGTFVQLLTLMKRLALPCYIPFH